MVMDVQNCMKATLLALSILSLVTWLSYMYSCVKTFFMESLPCAISAAIAPKCLFVFSNIIVVFLVSQSKLSRRSEALATDYAAAAAARNEIMLHDRKGEEEEEDEVVMAKALLLPPIIIAGDNIHEQEEHDTSIANQEGPEMNKHEEKVGLLLHHEADEVQGELLEEEGGIDQLVLRNKISRGLQQEGVVAEELEEEELPPADELNRRVEDFIARFNMERQLEEATMLVSCY